MAEKGIIFSAPMVRALLEGRKTQTRRLLTPRPVWEPEKIDGVTFGAGWSWRGLSRFHPMDFVARAVEWCPYAPGDRLYVREALGWNRDGDDRFFYRADQADVPPSVIPDNYQITNPYAPSIHMPRWASRLWLTVTDVRVQRVQEISEADARAEGVNPTGWEGSDVPAHCRIAFQDLWNSLHTKPGETWEANPWVVAISFDVHNGNVDSAP